jgi:PAS domain S-box-containing protein
VPSEYSIVADPQRRGSRSPSLSDAEMQTLRELESRQLTGVWRADFDTDRSDWSPAMYAIYGETPATFEPTFENIMGRLHPADAQLLAAQVEQWRARPDSVACSYRVIRPSGEMRVMEIRGWVDTDGAGHGTALLGSARDVTEEVLLRREKDRLNHEQSMILSASGDGICGLDASGRITFSNPALATLMQREGDELEGALLHDLLHRDADGGEVHELARCPFRGTVAGPTSATDSAFHRADGSRIEAAYVMVGVEDGDFRGSVVSFRDVTARRAAARLLQTSLQQVQSLSAQRGALLKHLAEAEERERLRIAADIHDDTIQSLSAVALRLAGARRRVGGGDDPEQVLSEAETEVRSVAQRLRGLMYELMEPMAGDDLRAAVQAYCEILFAGSEMTWEVSGEVRSLASERYLLAYRLTQEALRNALKHSRGTRVRVTMEATATELVICVADDGIGMDDAAGASTPPTHAGLRIVRQRAEAAGGTASFGPGLDGRGSGIEVRLPLAWSDMR